MAKIVDRLVVEIDGKKAVAEVRKAMIATLRGMADELEANTESESTEVSDGIHA